MEFLLIEEGQLFGDGRTVAEGALTWGDSPIPIVALGNWDQVLGTIKSIRREGTKIFGESDNFSSDKAELAITITDIELEIDADMVMITAGVIKACSTESPTPAVSLTPSNENYTVLENGGKLFPSHKCEPPKRIDFKPNQGPFLSCTLFSCVCGLVWTVCWAEYDHEGKETYNVSWMRK